MINDFLIDIDNYKIISLLKSNSYDEFIEINIV